MRFKRQGKAELAPQIIPSEDPQPDHQQMPVENCVNTVRVPRGRCNVRGFKRDGTTFHQSEKVLFQKMDADAILEVTTGRTVLTTPGTRDHAYQSLSTAFWIIHRLPRWRSIILGMNHCGAVASPII